MGLHFNASILMLSAALLIPHPALAAESKLKEATQQVESGAKSVGTGVEDTAKGVGKTVVEGAKAVGERVEDSGKAAEPQARSAWENVKKSASDFGQSVSSFFGRLFGK
jgi:hypothetical protein